MVLLLIDVTHSFTLSYIFFSLFSSLSFFGVTHLFLPFPRISSFDSSSSCSNQSLTRARGRTKTTIEMTGLSLSTLLLLSLFYPALLVILFCFLVVADKNRDVDILVFGYCSLVSVGLIVSPWPLRSPHFLPTNDPVCSLSLSLPPLSVVILPFSICRQRVPRNKKSNKKREREKKHDPIRPHSCSPKTRQKIIRSKRQ